MKILLILNILLITLFSCRNPKTTPPNTPTIEPTPPTEQPIVAAYWNTNTDTAISATRGIRNNNPSNIKRGAD